MDFRGWQLILICLFYITSNMRTGKCYYMYSNKYSAKFQSENIDKHQSRYAGGGASTLCLFGFPTEPP